jgi:hypothetical protein
MKNTVDGLNYFSIFICIEFMHWDKCTEIVCENNSYFQVFLKINNMK